jgi:hypothetical protein
MRDSKIEQQAFSIYLNYMVEDNNKPAGSRVLTQIAEEIRGRT